MISLHTLCCGLPVLALGLVALSGATAGTSVLLAVSQTLHGALHDREYWILALSAVLVGAGAWFELRSWRSGARRRVSPLFALSLGCFVFNIILIAVHRAA